MQVRELKAKVEEHRQGLKGKSGKAVLFGENGPVGMALIDAVVSSLETLEARIKEVERGARLGP